MTRFLEILKFGLIVFGRAFRIMFRRRQAIRVLHLDYPNNHIFESSFQAIHYRFRNALWYKIDGRNTLEKEFKIFNLPNAPKEFDLVVFGFFRKRKFRIRLQPTVRLESKYFQTAIHDFDIEFLPMTPVAMPLEFLPVPQLIDVRKSQVRMHLPNVTLKFVPYNQNELI